MDLVKSKYKIDGTFKKKVLNPIKFYREKKQKIEDIKKNIRDAILVSFLSFTFKPLNIFKYLYFCRQLQVL